jgi:molecular chaperone GrpE
MAEPEPRVRPVAPSGAPPATDGEPELLALLRRERADFLNYRRRVERERAEQHQRARAEAALRLLPLLDELDRAMARVPDDLAAHPWAQGVGLSRQHLIDALTGLGIERVGEVGEPFDPTRHDALFYETRPDVADQRVGAVIRAGYRQGDRLVRPAQVSVVGPASAPPAAPEATTPLPASPTGQD